MKTCSLNLKKCLTCSVFLLGLTLSPRLFAGEVQDPNQDVGRITADPESRLIYTSMRRDLMEHRQPSFARMIRLWEKRYGMKAVAPLLALGAQDSLKDHHRYIAIMAAAKMGGPSLGPRFLPFLKDRSWMIRNAAIRAISALNHPETRNALLPLVQDKALVVRNEAVRALLRTQPKGTLDALLEAATASDNFHGGKAQWVPLTALEGIQQMGAPRQSLRELRPLLDYEKDRRLLAATVQTLEKITGMKVSSKPDLDSRVQAWKDTIDQKRL